MRISSNFSTEELCHSETAEKYGIINQITTFEQRDAMFALVRKVLQPLRDLWGKPIDIKSGFVSPTLNEKEGGKATEQMMKGEAVEIATGSNEATGKMLRLIRETDVWNEIDQCVVYGTSIYVSHRRVGKQRQQIIYDKSYKGKRL